MFVVVGRVLLLLSEMKYILLMDFSCKGDLY